MFSTKRETLTHETWKKRLERHGIHFERFHVKCLLTPPRLSGGRGAFVAWHRVCCVLFEGGGEAVITTTTKKGHQPLKQAVKTRMWQQRVIQNFTLDQFMVKGILETFFTQFVFMSS